MNNMIQKFTKSAVFDEKIAGTLHLALGRAYPETGDNFSAIHWDMVCDLRKGGEVYIDNILFLQDGEMRV